jgi:hypothetical protein
VNKHWIYPVLALAPLVSASCTPHVAIDPIEVKPIQVDVNLNLKVDRELDNFYGDTTTQPTTHPATSTTSPTTTEPL